MNRQELGQLIELMKEEGVARLETVSPEGHVTKLELSPLALMKASGELKDEDLQEESIDESEADYLGSGIAPVNLREVRGKM